MKKILIYSYLYPNKMEPMKGIFVQERVKFLKQFCDLKVVAPIPYFPKIKFVKRWYKFSNIPKKEIIDGIEVYHPKFILFPRRIFRKYIGYWMYLLSKKLLHRIYLEWRFDLIHSHFTIYSGQAIYHFCKNKKIPFIITEHYGKTNYDITENSIYRKIYQHVFQNAKTNIVVSKRLKQEIQNKFPNINNIHLIPNGVDVSKFIFREKKIDKKKPKLISIGNLLDTKGFQYLIEALNILKNKGTHCKLTIIGEGKERKNLESMIAEFSLQEEVELVGYIPNNKIQQYFDLADIYVHPSLFESFGVVVIEAMASGKPVIVTKSGGPEYFVPDKFGIKIDKANSQALASGIRNMTDNYEFYNQNEIRNFVEENFNYKNIAKKIYQVYEDICQ